MLFLYVLLFITTVLAAPANVCSSGIYKDLLFLSAYPPAESYCSAHYPLPVSTVTVTTTLAKRNHHTTPSTTHTTPTATSCAACTKWSSVVAQAGAIVKTLCSCIETTPITTVTVTTTTTTSSPSPTIQSCSGDFPSSATGTLHSNVYRPFYSGRGTAETTANPANGPNGLSRAGYNDQFQCGALLQDCVNFADAGSYLSFDLYFSNSDKGWICTTYSGTQDTTDDKYFVTNSDAGTDMGWSA